MSSDPSAKLFYGYMQPESDKERYAEIDHNEDDTPWSATHTKRAHGCIGGIHGYDEHLGFFLAVETSLRVAEWDQVQWLIQQDFVVQQEWSEQLALAAEAFKLDTAGMEPGWFLVCLYF
jgi:hypothetical protein